LIRLLYVCNDVSPGAIDADIDIRAVRFQQLRINRHPGRSPQRHGSVTPKRHCGSSFEVNDRRKRRLPHDRLYRRYSDDFIECLRDIVYAQTSNFQSFIEDNLFI